MKKFALLLAAILAVPLCAHSQDLQFTDLVDFQSPTQPSLQTLFYAQFVFDPTSGQIVPGTMPLTAKQVAEWMLDELKRKGELYPGYGRWRDSKEVRKSVHIRQRQWQ